MKSSKGGKPGAKLKTPEPEPEPEPEEPPGPPPPQPADEEWEFVDLEIEQVKKEHEMHITFYHDQEQIFFSWLCCRLFNDI